MRTIGNWLNRLLNLLKAFHERINWTSQISGSADCVAIFSCISSLFFSRSMFLNWIEASLLLFPCVPASNNFVMFLFVALICMHILMLKFTHKFKIFDKHMNKSTTSGMFVDWRMKKLPFEWARDWCHAYDSNVSVLWESFLVPLQPRPLASVDIEEFHPTYHLAHAVHHETIKMLL